MATFKQTLYATVDQLRAYAQQVKGGASADQLTLLLQAASNEIDTVTGSWWDSRTTTITFSPRPEMKTLWFPAPVIGALTSVTEDGTVLTVDTDYYLGHDYIEKSAVTQWPSDWARGQQIQWNIKPNSVVVVGSMGYASTPEIIVNLCIAIAASLGDYRKRTFEDADGSIASVPISSYPAWITRQLRNLRNKNMMPQAFKVSFA